MVESRWKNENPPEEEFDTWPSPQDLLGHVAGRLEAEPIKRRTIERLRVGVIHAFARSASVGRQGLGLHTITLISRASWDATDAEERERLWEDGDLIVYRGGTTGYGDGYTERFLDVRFDPETLSGTTRPLPEEVPPQPTPPDPVALVPPPQLRNAGGRPRKDFWEDLLIEIFDRLWHGNLIPKTQADIENAMNDWLSAQGHEASERSVRDRARKLWNVWIKEGNN